MACYVWALGEEADFQALNCQPSTKVDMRQHVQSRSFHKKNPEPENRVQDKASQEIGKIL